MLKCIPLFTLMLSLWGFITPAFANLQGRVINTDRSPKSGVALTLQSNGETVVTDAQGAFSFSQTTSTLQQTVAQPVVRIENGMVVIHPSQRSKVTVQVFQMNGHPVSQASTHWVEAGEFQANPYQDLQSAGMYIVRIQVGAEQNSLVLRWTGNLRTSSAQVSAKNSTNLRKAAGSLDAITVTLAGTVIGESQVLIAEGNLPDIMLVQRTVKGTVNLNGQTLNSLMIDLVGSDGSIVNLDPSWDAGPRAYEVVAPWRVVNSAQQWNAVVKIVTAASATPLETSYAFNDNVQTVSIPLITLNANATSSSSTIKVSSSTVKPSSSAGSSTSNAILYIAPLDAKGTYAINWVWTNRMNAAQGPISNYYNTLYDKIMADKGTVNVCVRWESRTKITQAQRNKFEPMLNRSINNWTRWLRGYNGFPYDTIAVKIVGWAVVSKDYLDLTGLSTPVYVNGTVTLDAQGKYIPGTQAPYCPTQCARETYNENRGGKITTTYPGCNAPDQHFVTVIWGTDNFGFGGAGTEGGSRTSADYVLSVLDAQEPHIVEHEVGHGFGFPDYYEAVQCPDSDCSKLPLSIMDAGASPVITDWDKWSIRDTWTRLNTQTPARW